VRDEVAELVVVAFPGELKPPVPGVELTVEIGEPVPDLKIAQGERAFDDAEYGIPVGGNERADDHSGAVRAEMNVGGGGR
jgi:hypothetical protein